MKNSSKNTRIAHQTKSEIDGGVQEHAEVTGTEVATMPDLITESIIDEVEQSEAERKIEEPVAETQEPTDEQIDESTDEPIVAETQEPVVAETQEPIVAETQEPTDIVSVDGDKVESEEPETREPVAEVKKNILYVDSPIKKNLFDQVLRDEFTKPNGKFAGRSQANLAKPWIDIEVVVTDDPNLVGRNFEAQKGNWNFNDSNYVNPSENYHRLAAAARQANGGVEVHKKTLVGHLADLKKICMIMIPAEKIPLIEQKLLAKDEADDDIAEKQAA